MNKLRCAFDDIKTVILEQLKTADKMKGKYNADTADNIKSNTYIGQQRIAYSGYDKGRNRQRQFDMALI